MTGLRRKELASLTRADFKLDVPTPIVLIQDAYSKNKRTDEIPLHPDAVERLKAYFDCTNPEPGQPVFPLRTPGGSLRATAKTMKRDGESAGLKYSTTHGFFDFHANRVLFITSLCRSNVNLIMAQKLARHSDPKLTSNVYSKVTTEERAETINGISLRGVNVRVNLKSPKPLWQLCSLLQLFYFAFLSISLIIHLFFQRCVFGFFGILPVWLYSLLLQGGKGLFRLSLWFFPDPYRSEPSPKHCPPKNTVPQKLL